MKIFEPGELIEKRSQTEKPNFVRAAARPAIRRVRSFDDELELRWDMNELLIAFSSREMDEHDEYAEEIEGSPITIPATSRR